MMEQQAPTPLIPRIVHQTAPPESLTPEVRRNIEHLRALNPGWDYRFYDDAEAARFMRSCGPAVFDAWSRINPNYGAARADLFRYMLVLRFGGVYLDIKSSADRPLDSIIRADDEYLLSHWPNRQGEEFQGWGMHRALAALPRGEFQQWHVVARPGHPFLREVVNHVLAHIARYTPQTHGVGKKGVISVTGPIAYTRAIAPILAAHPHRIFDTHTEMGLRYSVIGSGPQQAHKSLFRRHYSQLDEPVVLPL